MPRGVPREKGAGRVDRGAYARLGRELSKGFPQMSDNDGPRPTMHGCNSCNEPTSTDHGICADCRSKGYN
jgi:hypothetical protein